MMELFVCSSNYQLLNAILIVKENKIIADLLVTRESIWDNCDLDILVEKGVFRKIYKWTYLLESLADDKIRKAGDKLKIQFKKVAIYLNKAKIRNSLPNKEELYSTVHIAYVDSITLWIYSFLKKKGTILSLFEDGTYSYGCLAIKKSTFRKVIEMFLYRGTGIDECRKMFVKHPEQVNVGSHKDVQLQKIMGTFDMQTISEVLLPLYKTEESAIECFRKQVVVFDQNLELAAIKQIQKEIAEQTTQVFENENVIVKLHPSSRDIVYGDCITTFSERIPFELILTYLNMTDKVLISIFSTSCMSPKLDYDQEPFVIFTYRLYGKFFSINSNYLDQIKQLSNKYKDKSKIAVPKDMNEFVQILFSYKERMQ